MAKKKILTENNKEILPITHEKCVLDNNGVSLAEKIGNMDDLMADSDDLVSAINEVTSFNNNFKGLIADSIGSPISADDSFNDIRNDINSLLNQFKTNMMNAGVVVESGDKFESLIEKIKGLTEGEGNKGIQYATGTTSAIPVNGSITVTMNLDFNPTVVFCHFPIVGFTDGDNNTYKNLCICSLYPTMSDNYFSVEHQTIKLTDLTKKSFKLTASPAWSDGDEEVYTEGNTSWYAIGVGEEDTTLRDSLADILENKGVEVSPEDDMADLITKVDSISSGGLDIISATELPATGRENQLCVITNNPVNNFKITTDITATYDCPDDNIVLYSGENNDGVQLYETTNGAVSLNYYFSKTQQGKKGLYLYKYNNGTWDNLTQGYMPFIENGTLVNTDYFGGIPTGSWKISNGALYLKSPGVRFIFITTANKINFSLFNTVEITARIAGGTNGLSNDALNLSVFYWNSPLNKVDQYTNLLQDIAKLSSDINRNYTFGKENVTNTIDISSWTGEYYFGIYWYTPMEHKCYITNITFR